MNDTVIDFGLQHDELGRIVAFIQKSADHGECVLIPVSGGLDSDVVARLCQRALGRERIKLLIVQQDEMESRFMDNALLLAQDLGVKLSIVDLRQMNLSLIRAAESADPDLFDIESLLDPMRAKCSMRSALLCSYQDKGYLLAGTSNRTEIELGFFMPFGDNLAHFKPIAHLYKTEVKQLASLIGCRTEVAAQAPSAGFWEGQEDIEDLTYWMINRGPIMGKRRQFSDAEIETARLIRATLSQEAVDTCLKGFAVNLDHGAITSSAGLPEEYVAMIGDIVVKARLWKSRPLLLTMKQRE